MFVGFISFPSEGIETRVGASEACTGHSDAMAIVKVLSLPRMNDGECKKYCSAETRTEHIMVNKDDSDTGMQSVLIETGLGVKETLGRFLSQAKEEVAVVEGADGLPVKVYQCLQTRLVSRRPWEGASAPQCI